MANNSIKPIAAALGAAFLASTIVPAASASANPFAATELNAGYDIVNQGKEGEGKCGGDKGEKGGEGKCGGAMGDKGDKSGEGKCGDAMGDKGDKNGEGKCGGDMDKKSKKGGEGKCGEGKCGG